MDRAAEMRLGRGSAAVLKTLLSNLRSKIPGTAIVVLEGKDDVPVFEAWIKRASEDFEWEPFVSNGKRNSLALRSLLQRDRTDLAAKVSFIVDHDYDGLNDQEDGQDVYVLPGYSIENFVTTHEAMDYFLRSSLQLHSKPELRADAKVFFLEQLRRYCEHLLSPCALLWAAKNSGAAKVEAKDSVIDNFSFDSGGLELKPGRNLSSLITFEGHIDEESIEAARRALLDKDLPLWIRGKYLLAFFEKCCHVLHSDLTSAAPHIFRESVRTKFEVGSASMSRLASTVQLPVGLREKVAVWGAH